MCAATTSCNRLPILSQHARKAAARDVIPHRRRTPGLSTSAVVPEVSSKPHPQCRPPLRAATSRTAMAKPWVTSRRTSHADHSIATTKAPRSKKYRTATPKKRRHQSPAPTQTRHRRTHAATPEPNSTAYTARRHSDDQKSQPTSKVPKPGTRQGCPCNASTLPPL